MAEEDDVVVRELDVYLCNGLLGDSTKMVLLQCPLRPPWRPYELDSASKTRIKPQAKRLQVEVPLSAAPANYNSDVEPALRIKTVVLDSQPVELGTSHVVGAIRGDRLLLCPVDDAMQLRPALSHLDMGSEAAGSGEGGSAGIDMEEDGKPQEQLMPLTVSVQRRETERQLEARLKSYAHLAAQEAGEAWRPLHLHPAASPAADSVWRQLQQPAPQALDMSLPRATYLASLVPGARVEEDETPAQPAADLEAVGKLLGRPAERLSGAAERPAAAKKVEGAAWTALPAALQERFRTMSVIKMATIRHWLETSAKFGQAKGVLAASDQAIHEFILAQREADGKTPSFTHIRRSYVLAKLGDPSADPLRSVVLQLLAEKEYLRKGDITAQADASGINMTDQLYTRVMRELCTSNRSTWSLRDGSLQKTPKVEDEPR